MYISIILYPLMNYLLCGLLGRVFGRPGCFCLSVFFIGFSFFYSVVAFYYVIKTNFFVSITIFQWASFNILSFSFSFLFDSLSCVMLVVVTSVSFLVHLYSGIYMQEDPYLPKFLSYLSLFTFFMLFYVLSGNFIQMFLGWEGIGLCSYLLINFWYTRIEANKSAIKAVVVNKVGDFGFFFGIILCILLTKGASFPLVNSVVLTDQDTLFSISFFGLLSFEISAITLICFFFLIGVVGKSAQIGLHMWLPDAMEGPTPVSALIHAATMVTAGVFLIIRASYLFEQAPQILIILIILGSLTAFFSGTIAVFQYDMKKIIAYSTCSQLGYMVLSCGLSGYDLALFHLFNHAFFKALLFLSSGVIIHFFSDEQDIRRYGFVIRILPFVFYSMLIGSLSLMGLPYLSGFYSKDKILELAANSDGFIAFMGYFFSLFGAFLTAIYSARLLYLVFFFSLNSKPFLVTYSLINSRFYTKNYEAKFARHLFFTHFEKLAFSSFISSCDYKNFELYSFTKLSRLGYFHLIVPIIFYFIRLLILPFFSFFYKNCNYILSFIKIQNINFFILFKTFFSKFSYLKFLSNIFFRLNFIFKFFQLTRYDFIFCLKFFFSGIYCFFCNICFFRDYFRIAFIFYLIICLKFFCFRTFWDAVYDRLILVPLILLLFGSIFSGYVFFDLFLGLGSDFFSGAIFTKKNYLMDIEMYNYFSCFCLEDEVFNFYWTSMDNVWINYLIPAMMGDTATLTCAYFFFLRGNYMSEHDLVLDFLFTLPLFLKLLPFFFSILGFFLIPFFYNLVFNQNNILNFWINCFFYKLSFFFNQKWFFDQIYLGCSFFLFKFFFSFYLLLDKGFLEKIGPQTASFLFKRASFISKFFHTGSLTTLLNIFLLSFILFLCIFFYFYFFFFIF